MKQTAVEWLIDELELNMFATDEEMEIIIKAKEMEKEQLESLKDFDVWKEWKNKSK